MSANETGEGVLILVAGPSGSGKDTLIDAARRAFSDDRRFYFPKRVITRGDQSGEDHIHVSLAEFLGLGREGRFFLSWEAHGLHYGIPADTLDRLLAGETVIANVSRRVVSEARAKWPRTEAILLSVDPEILRARLIFRGRESEAQIEERVRRAKDKALELTGCFHVLDNSGPIEESAGRFISLIRRLSFGPSAAQHVSGDEFERAAALRLSQ